MSKREELIVLHLAVGLAMMLAGLFGLDRVVAEYLHSSGQEGLRILVRGTEFLDAVTGKEISKFLIGLLLTGGALVLLTSARTRIGGWSVLFVGLVQLFATLLAGVSKNAFGRLRPFQLLQSGDWSHQWFVAGNAFPSGHAGFYFGLFMPIAYLFPRWRWPLMLIPWFIAVARVNANDHFVSDVAVSIALVSLLTLFVARFTRQRMWLDHSFTAKPPGSSV